MQGDASATGGQDGEDCTELGRSIEQGLREALAHARGEMPAMTIHYAQAAPERVGDETGIGTTEEPSAPPPKRRTPRPPSTHKATTKEVRRADELAALLTKRPAVLVTEREQPMLPFKVGIKTEFAALLRPEVSTADLKRALFRYSRSVPYQLACLRPGAMRHDLDGKPVEKVSEEHRAMTRAALAGMRAKQNERRKVAHTEAVTTAPEPDVGGQQ